MEENKKVKINGKTYQLVADKIGDGNECERCDLYEYCTNENGGNYCVELFGDDATDCRFEQCAEPLTEQQAYDAYQERSAKSGERGDALAWAMIALQVAQLIGGRNFREFYIMAASAAAYMLLSMLQSVWQTFTIWLTKQRISKSDEPLTDYPEWVGFGAWTFYWLKMGALTAGAVYGIWRFLQVI